jgi:hypothetical protein
MEEINHILVFEVPVDFNFTHQLLLGSGTGKSTFLNNFSSMVVVVLLI